MPLNLTWKDATRLPVEGGTLRPDALAGLSADDVSRLRLPIGNTSAEVGELFQVEGDAGDGEVDLAGDLSHVRAIGAGMASGRIRAAGDVGPRAGLGMSGGTLIVEGSAGVWAGAEMTGGLLRITGDAGDCLGSALPGSRVGMRDGIILVSGAVGLDVGLAMRRGLIAIRGAAGPRLGRGMVAGSVFAFGPVGDLAGMGMRRGTIALFGQPDYDPLPTFNPSGRDRPPFLTVYFRHMQALGFDLPASVFSGNLARYNGDRADRGQGEILVWG